MADAYDPLLFVEKRINTSFLTMAFAVSVAGGITLLMLAWQQHRWQLPVPIGLLLLAWGMMMGGNLRRRRQLSPILRLESDRLRYIGAPAWAPRLHDIPYDEITSIEKENRSVMRLRLASARRPRTIPIGLLPRAERRRFSEALRARCHNNDASSARSIAES
ncbi:hypothetical protein [Kushneria phosphatilytica]|uniref:Uncharacterized protein n=1 Tax=Kushneria phosphatilytica TaxID=657387 RepID=A0A1S1NZ23_9GAMM|nr:hypothetical protein [Kushneria phosphatilytica]OHV13446.1 hypothetical protein BH688_01095 [Kushneria phosphatilytica]QEL10531.1 hypothetical protein FY550_04850 [Kushneria phosphatilytica]